MMSTGVFCTGVVWVVVVDRHSYLLLCLCSDLVASPAYNVLETTNPELALQAPGRISSHRAQAEEERAERWESNHVFGASAQRP